MQKTLYEVRERALEIVIQFLGSAGGEGFQPKDLIEWAENIEKYLTDKEDKANAD